MKDQIDNPLFAAIGEILKEERGTTTAGLADLEKRLRDAITEHEPVGFVRSAELDALRADLAKDFAAMAASRKDASFYDALQMKLDAFGDSVRAIRGAFGTEIKAAETRIEHALEALDIEAVVKRVIRHTDKHAPTVEKITGEVVAYLTANSELFKGADGADGKDAEPLDYEFVCANVAARVSKALPDLIPEPIPGVDGKDADPAEVAACLLELPDFVEGLKGKDGLPGKDGADVTDGQVEVAVAKGVADLWPSIAAEIAANMPEHDNAAIAKFLATNKDFLAAVTGPTGKDGRDADPAQVKEHLLGDPAAVDLLRGEKGAPGADGAQGEPGPQGEPGQPGTDGASVDADDVADILVVDEGFQKAVKGPQGERGPQGEPGAPGADATPAQVAGELWENKDFRDDVRGAQGEPGPKGEPGEAGRDRPLYEVRPLKAGVQLAKNDVGFHDGGLWMATRKTAGTPTEDPMAWANVLTGIAEANIMRDEHNRTVTYVLRLSDGETVSKSFPDMPRWIDPDAACARVPGDMYMQDTSLHLFTGDDWQAVDLLGPQGVRGRKGAPGNDGVGIKRVTSRGSVLENTATLIVEYTDGTKGKVPLDFDTDLIKDLLADLAMPAQVPVDQAIIRFAGMYDYTASYSAGDVVNYMGGLYLATADGISDLQNTSAWARMSSGEGGMRNAGGGSAAPASVATPANPGALATVLATPGALAQTQNNGQLYIANPAGGWQPVGKSTTMVANVAALATIGAPTDGDMAWARAEDKLFLREGAVWKEVSGSPGVLTAPTEAARLGFDPTQIQLGSLVYQQDTSILWEYTGTVPANPGTVGAAGNWQQITSAAGTPKVIEVNDFATLAGLAVAAAADTTQPLYRVMFDNAGQPLNRLYVWDATAAGFLPAETRTTVKALLADPDPAANLKRGDVVATIEPDHAEVKTYDGAAWQMLFSEDEIKQWIAAGSLFRGTVMPAPTAGGAIPLAAAGVGVPIGTPVTPTTDVSAGAAAVAGTPDVRNTDAVVFFVELAEGYAGPAPAAGSYMTVAQTFTVDPNPIGGSEYSLAGVTLNAGDTVVYVGRGNGEVGITNANSGDGENGYMIVPAGAFNAANPVQRPAVTGTVGLPVPDAAHLGNYWTWVGPPNTLIDAATPVIGTDLNGQTLQVGDWLQIVDDGAGGYGWAHVPSDLLSKLRGDRLYSIQPWADGTWEVNSVVNHQGRLWRAARGVTAGDAAPQMPGIPLTIRGHAMDDYVTSAADIIAWIGGHPPTPANVGQFVVVGAGGAGTIAAGAGTITTAVGDAIINLGDFTLGTGGLAVVPGPFNVVVDPAAVINAKPRNTVIVTDNAIPIASEVQYAAQLTGTPANGQRYVVTVGFTAPAGTPFAGQLMASGDTIWWTGDPNANDAPNRIQNGWQYIASAAPGPTDVPPVIYGPAVAPTLVDAGAAASAFSQYMGNAAAANSLSVGDIITFSAAGTLGLPAGNVTAGQAIAAGDYVKITGQGGLGQPYTFDFHPGPYVAAGTRTVTVTRGRYGRGFQMLPWDATAVTDNLAKYFTKPNPSVGDVTGYTGNGRTHVVDATWQSAGNYAGQALPSVNQQDYLITVVSVNPLFYDIEAVASLPAGGAHPTNLGDVTAQVPASAPVANLSAQGVTGITWNELLNTANLASPMQTNGIRFPIGPGAIFTVGTALPVAQQVGPNAANLQAASAGDLEVGDSVMLASLGPVRWVVQHAPFQLQVGFFFEGDNSADPATLTYNKPATYTPPNPMPSVTLPGIAAGAMPWTEIPIEGDFHTVLNDTELPAGGAAGDQVYFVATSAMANGDPALYSYTNGAWEPLGGASSGVQSGNAFPPAAAPNAMFWRDDLSIMFYWDGANWVQVSQTVTGPLGAPGATPADPVMRADEGLYEWHAGDDWAVGTVVYHNDKLYKATTTIDVADPEPGVDAVVPGQTINVPFFGTADPLDGNIGITIDSSNFENGGRFTRGIVSNGPIQGNEDVNNGQPKFDPNWNMQNGDEVMWLGDATLQGTTAQGWIIHDGFILMQNATKPTATPFDIVIQDRNVPGPWEEIGDISPNVAARPTTHLEANPVGPLEGDLWLDKRMNMLRVREGNTWLNANSFKGQAGAPTPLPGSFWYDSTNNKLKMFYAGSWHIMQEEAGDQNMAQSPPTKNWNGQTFIPENNTATHYLGQFKCPGTAGHPILAWNKVGGGKIVDGNFIRNTIMTTDFGNNGSASVKVNYKAGGSGGGWYSMTSENMKANTWATFDMKVARFGEFQSVEVNTVWQAVDGHMKQSICQFIWSNNDHPLSNLYFSNINDGSGNVQAFMRPV